MVGQSRRPPARAALDAGALATVELSSRGRRPRTFKAMSKVARCARDDSNVVACDFGEHDPPPLFILLALSALAAPALAKDELVLGMTQAPGTWNPLISSMLAKSLISNMTARPLTAYDADWKLVCLVCTELPTIENGKARVIDLPMTAGERQEGHGGRRRAARHEVGRRRAGHRQGRRLHPRGRQASAVGRRLVGRLQAHPQVRHQGRPPFHHDDRPRDLRLQQPRPRASCRRTSRSRSSTPIPPSTATRPPTTPTRPIPGLAFGPYRIVEVVPGSRIVLEQNPTWTGEKPHFKRIVVKIIENTAALEANLLSGNVDYVLGELGLSLDQALAFEKRHKDKYDFIYKPALIYEHIDIMLDNKLLADRRVRQAILMAIDRKAISDKLFEGKQPVADGADQPARSDVQPGGTPLPLRSGGGAQAAGRGGLRRDQERRAPERQGRALLDRDHDHRRQPRARAGGAGDPEPAAARSASSCASRPSRRASSPRR